jgi:hypothetical protein
VPKVSIDEDQKSGTMKYDVGRARYPLNVLPEPKPRSMKRGAQNELNRRILSADAGHDLASLLFCQAVCHLMSILTFLEKFIG